MTHLYFGKVCFRAASGAGPAHISTVLKWGSRSLCHHSALVKSKDTIERIHIYPIHRIDHDASPTASNPYRSDLRPLGAHNTISKLYLIISRYRAPCVVNSHDYDAAPCCEVRVPQKRSIALSGPNSAFYVSFAMTLDFFVCRSHDIHQQYQYAAKARPTSHQAAQALPTGRRCPHQYRHTAACHHDIPAW